MAYTKKDDNTLNITTTKEDGVNEVSERTYNQLIADRDQAVASLVAVKAQHKIVEDNIQVTIDLFNKRIVEADKLGIKPKPVIEGIV